MTTAAAEIQKQQDAELVKKAVEFRDQIRGGLIEAGLDWELASLVKVDLKREAGNYILDVDAAMAVDFLLIPDSIGADIDKLARGKGTSNAQGAEIGERLEHNEILDLHNWLDAKRKPDLYANCKAQLALLSEKIGCLAEEVGTNANDASMKIKLEYPRTSQVLVEDILSKSFPVTETRDR